MSKTISFDTSEKRGGLNNQKMALLGLCIIARETNRKVRWPVEIIDLHAANYSKSDTIKFSDVFDTDTAAIFLHNQDLSGQDDVSYAPWGDCFKKGREAVMKLDANHDLIADFIGNIRPAAHIREAVKVMIDSIDQEFCTLQLRIELDWQKHAKRLIDSGTNQNFIIDPKDIFKKVFKSKGMSDSDVIYCCCDSKAMDRNPSDIKDMARNLFNKEIIFKEDIINHNFISKSSIQNAMLDFEFCLQSKKYVGLKTSTFSQMLLLKANVVQDYGKESFHYVYDNPESTIQFRKRLSQLPRSAPRSC